MSWLVVFMSSILPIVLLAVMLAMDRLQRDRGPRPSPVETRQSDGSANVRDRRLLIA